MEPSSFATMGSSVATLVAVASEVAVICVVATVVRRHRPDAYAPLLTWAIASLVTSIATYLAYMLAAWLVGAGPDGYVFAIGVIGLARSGVTIVLLLLLVRGLVAIAQPPKHAVMTSDAPYR